MVDSYTIDRKTASRLLKVSIRTVDRYVKVNKLLSEERDGRIWLDKGQIGALRSLQGSRQSPFTSESKMSIDKSVHSDDGMSIDSVYPVSTQESAKANREKTSTGGEVYQKLFEELQNELKQKQERLEGANYRVGQLEGLLRESVPLLDHNRLLLAERTEKQELEAQHLSLRVEYDQMTERYRDEHMTKKIMIIVIFIIILLQPLWLFLSIRK
jgi:hypothetical protein